jgi:hypothetical protein
MTPSERHTRLIRLLAHIDQQIAEAESLASDASLDADERERAGAQLSFQRRAVERVEAMLGEAK